MIYDFCIIRAGPNGTLVANELAKKSKNVIFIEGGGNSLDGPDSLNHLHQWQFH